MTRQSREHVQCDVTLLRKPLHIQADPPRFWITMDIRCLRSEQMKRNKAYDRH
jgi:hypothetical protein